MSSVDDAVAIAHVVVHGPHCGAVDVGIGLHQLVSARPPGRGDVHRLGARQSRSRLHGRAPRHHLGGGVHLDRAAAEISQDPANRARPAPPPVRTSR